MIVVFFQAPLVAVVLIQNRSLYLWVNTEAGRSLFFLISEFLYRPILSTAHPKHLIFLRSSVFVTSPSVFIK